MKDSEAPVLDESQLILPPEFEDPLPSRRALNIYANVSGGVMTLGIVICFFATLASILEFLSWLRWATYDKGWYPYSPFFDWQWLLIWLIVSIGMIISAALVISWVHRLDFAGYEYVSQGMIVYKATPEGDTVVRIRGYNAAHEIVDYTWRIKDYDEWSAYSKGEYVNFQ